MPRAATLSSIGAAGALALCAVGSPAAAEESSRPTMTAAGAQAVVAGCLAYAAANGAAVAVAVYDEGGNLYAYARMDGVAVGVGDVAQWKGQSAARNGFSTAVQGQFIARGGAAVAVAPGFAGVQGGLPILSADGRVMGGAGAGGSAPAQDEACVRAGIEAAGYSAPPAAE
jgi:uncharacterized protein GlcG (DUF336 family)